MWICAPQLIVSDSEFDAGVVVERARLDVEEAARHANELNNAREQMRISRMMETYQDSGGNVMTRFVNDPAIAREMLGPDGEQYCADIKCGRISQQEAGMLDVYACSLAYGPGVGGDCLPALIPEPAPTTNPAPLTPAEKGQPLTPQTLTQPQPDITQAFVDVERETAEPSLFCQINKAVSDNPLLAALGLGLAYLAFAKK